jgi:hypothetical protein
LSLQDLNCHVAARNRIFRCQRLKHGAGRRPLFLEACCAVARWGSSLAGALLFLKFVGKVLSSRILGANLQGIDRWSTPDSKTPSRGGTQKGKMCFLGRFGGQSGLAVLPGSRAPLIKERMSEDCPVHCWCNNTYRIHTIRTRRYMSAAPLLLVSPSNPLSCACAHI